MLSQNGRPLRDLLSMPGIFVDIAGHGPTKVYYVIGERVFREQDSERGGLTSPNVHEAEKFQRAPNAKAAVEFRTACKNFL